MRSITAVVRARGKQVASEETVENLTATSSWSATESELDVL
jgi:hypothetical protein